MDPFTHASIGLAVAKVCANPISITDPATMCIVAGSVFPDIDILLQKKGDLAYLKNHRGATHSLVGTLASAAIISGIACLAFRITDFPLLFFWALLGCWSHVFFDLFNSFGAQLLWPFINKKFSLGMMVSFDPVFIGLLLSYVFLDGNLGNYSIIAFLTYFAFRMYTRIRAARTLENIFGLFYNKISILPSLKGLYKWQFILEKDDCSIIGEMSFTSNKIKMLKYLKNFKEEKVEHVLSSEIGRFFREFTPFLHVSCEKNGDRKKYVLTDLRYFLARKFLHHAVVLTDENDTVIEQRFVPYSSAKRSHIIQTTEYQMS